MYIYSQIKHESSEIMIQITKEQAQFLRTNGVKEGITRPMKQKSKRGKRIWCAEDRYILALLDEFNKNVNVVLTYGTV
jgi:hypothetical protein